MENTLVLVKPDGVKKGLTGEIIRRFEQRGLQIVALKMLRLSEEKAKIHYEEHKEKPFFGELVDFITSGPIVAMVVRGEKAIKVVRTMMGTTNPVEAAPGTIRGDFALSMAQNIIHGSDSELSAIRETKIYFQDDEIQG
ncbi:nucleoside-diphosphate kinase [Anaerosporomusa subterranea]|jgi:nucleoside-diphosphate kinase|uniref:Nucleoside diphosphate kinase n=1 Tax=Anaerosporomusa subterranea TaxID=1794912 RepID=A0A154BTS6_ANASB|nr:nucleoside-diphosphate kinase [Anaerosporomusa subterranea]KYZ77413.1 nucleoside-diphosphate kinase [Anaerosporomusa subterranea]